MKLSKKIKRFIGLELPYLLEEEEKEYIETANNILNISNKNYSDMLDMSSAMIQAGISCNGAREYLGLMPVSRIEVYRQGVNNENLRNGRTK